MSLKPINEKITDLKVLYVEDELSIREAVKELLTRRIPDLLFAENGVKGLEVFEKYLPDIVITDIRMPQMDGLAMSRRMKEIKPEVKIIVTSAYSDSNFFIEAIEIGINEYVLKPITLTKLFESVYRSAESIYMHRKLNKQWDTISKLHGAIEQSQGMVVITDQKRKIEYLNPRFTEITGFTVDEVTGPNAPMSFDLLCNSQANEPFRKVLEGGKQWRGEYSIIHKNGQSVSLFGSLSPVLDIHGNVSSFVLVGQDISELKQVQAALSASEDKLRNLIERLGEGIAILDLTWDFVFCNEAMKEIFESDELVEKNISSFISTPQEMQSLAQASRKLKIGEKLQLELSIRCSSGSNKYVSVTLTPQLDSNVQGITGLFCIFKDMTQVKNLIEELQAARDAAQQAYQTIEEKNLELSETNKKLSQSEVKLSELNGILMEYIKATGK
ncbi:MAG: PAS domain S-box protein [Bacteroidales bacterium]